MNDPETVAREPEAAAAELECARCGSPASPHQEYCLECGARLPPPDTELAGPGARAREGARESLLTVFVAFVVAVIAAAAVVAVQMTRDDTEQPLLVETRPAPAEPPATGEGPTETALPPGGTIPGEEEPELPPEEPVPEPPQQQLIGWPEGTDGFTVILASIPTSSGRAPATARAREARDAGLPEVGVLVSAEFASLRPGYFVVFSGVYATRAEAEDALPTAGTPEAYVGEVTR